MRVRSTTRRNAGTYSSTVNVAVEMPYVVSVRFTLSEIDTQAKK